MAKATEKPADMSLSHINDTTLSTGRQEIGVKTRNVNVTRSVMPPLSKKAEVVPPSIGWNHFKTQMFVDETAAERPLPKINDL